MKDEFAAFVTHVERVVQQHNSVKQMQDHLPANHALIQMDFSENYNSQTMEEIQSAYWNASMVTLHPNIIYFKDASKCLSHKSLVFVSEVLHHNATMVYAIVQKIVNTVHNYLLELKHVHCWAYSPIPIPE